MKKQKIIGTVLVVVFAIAAFLYSGFMRRPVAEQVFSHAHASPSFEEVDDSMDYVLIEMAHITGEVNEPGVFSIFPGMRVFELIDLAGGATEYADLVSLNLSQVVVDQQQIVVPRVGQNHDSGGGSATIIQQDPRVNVNTATREQLLTLPGVGDVMAGRIIARRDSFGNFNSPEDLLEVSGIGERTLENLLPHVRFR